MKRTSEDYSFLTEFKSADEKKRKKKSRWGGAENEKVIIPGLSTTLPPNLTPDQEKIHIMTLQVEEISRRLRSGILGIPVNPGDRSPSPEPLYNNEGKRVNTREVRVRKKLEEERHSLIQKLMGISTEYKPPNDYKPPLIRYNDRVVIPQEEYPHINFMGLLIGPRGNTLKQLEKETGTKIIIRGRGSVKEGKLGGRKDGMPYPGEDDPLHAWITASSEEIVAKAKQRIEQIIKQGIEVPDEENDLRKQQLVELALINGTYKENEGLIKLRQIAEAGTIATNNIICGLCGGTGHLAIDCKVRKDYGYTISQAQAIAAAPTPLGSGDVLPPGVESNHSVIHASAAGTMACGTLATFYASGIGGISSADRTKMDSEYSALMVELGVKSSELAAPGSAGSSKFVDRTMTRGITPVPPPPPPSAAMSPYGTRPPYPYYGPPVMQAYQPQSYHPAPPPPPPPPGSYGYQSTPMPPPSYPPLRPPSYLPPPPPWTVPNPVPPARAPPPPPPPPPPTTSSLYPPHLPHPSIAGWVSPHPQSSSQ